MEIANPFTRRLWCFLQIFLLYPRTNASILTASGGPLSICSWFQPAVAIVRDHIYIDGGLRENVDINDMLSTSSDEVSWSLNLTTKFNILTDNLTLLLEPVPQAQHPDNYYGGLMFADDDNFFVFGGMPVESYVSDIPPADSIYAFNLYPSKLPQSGKLLEYGPFPAKLSHEVNRYLIDGAGASTVSEKLAFYFSGMTGPNAIAFTDESEAVIPSNSLITMNLTQPGVLESSSADLPDFVLPRANGALVWLPVSSHGMLVSLGGVILPEQRYFDALNESQIAESEKISPSFMSTVSVYDIGSATWYNQNVTKGPRPGQLAQFCAVLATDTSSSTYNIYVYGGYNGVAFSNVNQSFVPHPGDIWVLSIPSFTWTKVLGGNPTDGRLGHSCVSPYPDQMWAIGGQPDGGSSCLPDSFIKIFNLNNLTWQDEYDPTVWEEYRTPAVVQKALGNVEASGATTNGMPTDMNPKLVNLFNTPYPTPIKVWYPYAKGSRISREVEVVVKHVFSNWIGGFLGVVLYLFISTICTFWIVVIRRRMLLRRMGAEPLSSSDTQDSKLVCWMNNIGAQTREKETMFYSEKNLTFASISNISVAAAVPATHVLQEFALHQNKADSTQREQVLSQEDKRTV